MANVQKPDRDNEKKKNEDPGKKAAPGRKEKSSQGASEVKEGQSGRSGQHARDEGSKPRSDSDKSSVTGDEDSDDDADGSR